jgi:ribonuclease HIII
VKALTSHTCKLNAEQAAALKAYLDRHDFRPREVPYARFAGERPGLNVVFYESGKLVVQGKGTQEFVEFTLEPEILREARLGYEAVLNPELLDPRLGIDESGKGDFFGPICVAGVYLNAKLVEVFTQAGVRDSKTISSDRRIGELAETILRTPGCVTAVVPIGNEAYNRLHAKLGTVNAILAWGHARAIENLLAQRERMDPPPTRAISDQFASSPAVLRRALMTAGRAIELVQRHKAESDIAVAAASILARHEFVSRLGRLEKEFGLRLPKGASGVVEEAARGFVQQHGANRLPSVAKMHFVTAQRVLAAAG